MGDYDKKPKNYRRGRCLEHARTYREERERKICTSGGLPCVVDIFVLAGVNAACEACEPSIQQMRDLHGYKPEGHGFYVCDGITPDQQEMVRAAIQQRIDEADELAAHESMYGREEREMQLSRHGDECDCDACEASRDWLRNMRL